MYVYSEMKIVIILDKQLESWIALNVVGHLSVALGALSESELMGRHELLDASGVTHRGISKYPLVVLSARKDKLLEVVTVARSLPELFVGDYPKEMLVTGHDDELCQAISLKSFDQLEYLGVLLFGPTEVISKITSKFSVWKK
jgi:hypothetical protein